MIEALIIATVMVGGWTGILLLIRMESEPVEQPCPVCHYNLRGLQGPICPECGSGEGRAGPPA